VLLTVEDTGNYTTKSSLVVRERCRANWRTRLNLSPHCNWQL